MTTRPKAVIESRNGEKLSPITIAKNVLTDDGQNLHDILSDRKEDMMTPTIENSSSMFKVGQGDNVDYSSNVVNGAYEDMVLKGKTMVNCIQESSSKDVVLPYEFADGQYVTINDTKESGALGVELKGQTLVNVVDYNDLNLKNATRNGDYFTLKHGVDINQSWIIPKKNKQYLYKPNTVYTIIVNITENTTGQKLGISNIYTCTSYINGKNRFDNLLGESKLLVRTGSDVNVPANQNEVRQLTYFGIWDGSGDLTSHIKFNFMILEGDWTDKETPPYFEGMASCKRPVLHTAGSLFDAQKIIPNNTFTYSHSTNIGRFEFTNRVDVVANTNIQLPAGTYDISFLVRGACDNGRVAITFAKDGQVWHNCSRVEINYGEIGSTTFKEVKSQRTFDAPVTVTIVGHAWSGGATGSGWCEFKDIRFTPVGKTSILSTPSDLILRGIGDVRDELNMVTGELTQRFVEIVLDGVNYKCKNITTNNDETKRFDINFTFEKFVGEGNWVPLEKMNASVISDKAVCVYNGYSVHPNKNAIASYNGIPVLFIEDKTILSIEQANQWLQQNPITVQYELKTPIVKTVDLNVVDQNGSVIPTLKSWNTTTHIYSEIPENSLYPILSHSNPTYPVILKPSTKYSIVANSYSNNHANSAINFNLGGTTASTTVGNRVTTITTPSTLSNELLTMSGRGNKLNNVMVIEGDVAGDEPYFEGMCDSKSPILSNIGKNLLPTELSRSFKHIAGNQVVSSIDLTSFLNRGVQYVIKLAIPKNVKIAKHYSSNSADIESVLVSHGVINSNNTIARFTIPSNSNSYYLFVNESGQSPSDYISDISELVTIELDTGNVPTEITPYKSNITTFDQKDDKTIVLRSLPNGVCDTLNVETGEYIQRIGELVADGSNIGYNINAIGVGEMDTFRFQLSDPSIKNVPEVKGNLICDQLPWRVIWSASVERTIGCYVANSENRIVVRMLKEKFDTLNVDGINRYLTNNPITFQYELATPIVSTVDIQGFPYAYANGHVQLSSGSIGQSLTPKVEYSVATNRNGQIRSNQKMVERHQKQLDRLQAMILTNLVDTQYEQTLTNLKYDLKNVREEVK